MAVHSIPRAEYPRPDLVREGRWLNLNGDWEFLADRECGFNVADELPQARWQDTIVVPYAWETSASTIERSWLERGWYRRTVSVPPDWTPGRVVLRFGAVHHRATVWLDGVELGVHEGGYTPFEFDITEVVRRKGRAEQQQIVVRVDAPSDKRGIVHGKQRSLPPDDYDDVAFLPTSGIWQTVWLEHRPQTYLASLALRGDRLDGIAATAYLGGDLSVAVRVTVTVSDGAETVAGSELDRGGQGHAHGFVAIPNPRLWSPPDPFLYRVTMDLTTPDGSDRVHVTTGLRRFETRGEHFYLNDERYYLRGVLDQGYWPSTGMTAPTAQALRTDLELARDAGYNLVRKHLKFEDPIWLHEADQLGVLVWEEPACSSRYRPEAISAFEAQLPAMVERDGNHPSIVIWGLYNEEWGLDWDLPGDADKIAAVRRAYDQLKALDASRPIVENSGWAHVKTDIVDWHHYVTEPRVWKDTVAEYATGKRESIPVPLGDTDVKDIYGVPDHPRHGIPFINSEYGTGYTSLQRGWQLRWQTQELRRHDRIAGYIYCELTDIEHEMAGFRFADRGAKDLGGVDLSDINAETTLVFDTDPVQAGVDVVAEPGEELVLPVRVSHHGGRALPVTIAACWSDLSSGFPAATSRIDARSPELVVQPFQLSQPARVRVTVPAPRARLCVWAEHEGLCVARGFLDVGYTEVAPWRNAR